MPESQPTGIYRLTSIGRPVDPAHPWNRALLLVLPLLAVVSGGIAAATGDNPLAAALAALLTGFAAWALTRELAPDDDAAAFVALALAFIGHVVFAANAVAAVFLALFLARIVNRSTGLPARPFDTVAVLGLVLWLGLAGAAPLLLLIGGLAFLLDASLIRPLRRHYVAAAVCLGAFGWSLVDAAPGLAETDPADGVLLGVFLLLTLAVARYRSAPESRCDATPERLDRLRVDAALVIGYLVAAQSVLQDGTQGWTASPLWACIVAVTAGLLFRRIA